MIATTTSLHLSYPDVLITLIHGPCGTISSAASNQFIKALKWMLSDLLHASMCKSVQHGCDSCMLFAIAFVIHD
ncbi:hypothetical protein EMCRGX_G013399 [Ephydatia muelleri]